jgi:4-hydroxythreonine-4-phosphate dehydrogenase
MTLSTSTTPPERAAPLLLTMGDACGIGPEIIARSFALGCAPGAVVVADLAVMQRAAAMVNADLRAVPITDMAQAQALPTGCIPVYAAPGIPSDLMHAPLGQVDARAGLAAHACVVQAVRLVQSGQGRAIVTAPIHKAALAAAHIPYPGHTELLQALTSAPGAEPAPVRMMLASPELRVVLVTIHMALRRAIDAITTEAIVQTLQIAHQSAQQLLGLPQPKIAVAGLNPHAGEGGLFGDEERRIIAPAIQAAQAQGIHASGPYAPDTIFMRARHTLAHPGEFDLVIAMTHDHGLIPIKYLGIEHGVNITLGLPFLRTSPDHGTAFDIATQARADPRSLIAALEMATSGTSPEW